MSEPVHSAPPTRPVAAPAAPRLPAPSSHADAPLGLPTGSVRAMLTLLTVALVMMQTVRGQEVGAIWTHTLMIALGHYFTQRPRQLDPALIRALEAEGRIPPRSVAARVPHNAVRVLIVLSFVALALHLYAVGRLLDPAALSLLGAVFSYSAGLASRLLLYRGRDVPPSRFEVWWSDTKARLVLVIFVGVAIAQFLGLAWLIPRQVENFAVGMMLFYFGSR